MWVGVPPKLERRPDGRIQQDEGKVHEEKSLFGIFSTTTEDASGGVRADPSGSPLGRRGTRHDAAQMVGEIEQVPPMYSAVKVTDVSHEYARAGEEVERPVRQVAIYEFTRTSEISYEEQPVFVSGQM